ncbi:MAG: hypothetical protein ABT940_13130 [Alphaproteobacteria bacterium]
MMAVKTAVSEWESTRDLGDAKFLRASAEGSNARTVQLQLYDREGREMQKRAWCMAYLSSASDGSALEAVSATLTLAAADTGVGIVGLLSAANSAGHSVLFLVGDSTGKVNFKITQTSGADTFYVVVCLPNGDIYVTPAITFA